MNIKAIKKGIEIIKDVQDYGKLTKHFVSVSDFVCFFNLIEKLASGETAETLNWNVKHKAVKCGFAAVPEGIGWRIM